MANNLFIDFLPPWVETGVQPAFYDKESGTVLQQTARMYAKVNELTQSVNHYIEQFTELYDYVHDYFDNLNVQEEINNKLDQMAQDGSLDTLIGNYIDPIINDFKEDVNEEVGEIEAKVNALSSGTPIPVSSTSDMTDTSKVYVNTTDGKWYYYDGDSWEIGGTYQSTGIGNGSIDILKLGNDLQSNFILDFGEPLSLGNAYVGYYKENGVLVNDNGFANYHVALTNGKIYNFTGRNFLQQVSLVVKDSSNNVVFTNATGGTTKYVHTIFKCNANNLTAYISCQLSLSTAVVSNNVMIRESTRITNALKYSNTVPLIKTISGGYVNSTYTESTYSRVQISSDANASTKMYQMSKGRTYLIKATDSRKMCGYAITNEDYDLLEYSSDEDVSPSRVSSITYTATEDGFIFLSDYNTNPSVTIVNYGITVPATNVLTGKKLAVTGDSICAGDGYRGGYAILIALNNNMQVQNIAVGGGTVTSGTTSGGNNRFWINESIVNLDSDADYVLIEGGCNDSGLGVTMGTLTSGYGSSFDTTTYIGAFENMCYQLTKRFKGKKYGYVFVHQWTANFRHSNTDQETSYYWQAKKVLEKWCIPYIDLNIECPPLGYFQQTNADLYAIRTAYTKDGDGVHPNKDGYEKYYVDKITSFLKSL